MNLKKVTKKDRYGNTMSYEFEGDTKQLDPTRLMEKQMDMMQVPEMEMEVPSTYDHPGEPRGSDTVPAWLTPGEFVVNAEAMRIPGAAEQVEAINDMGREVQMMQGGSIPEYHDGGGFVDPEDLIDFLPYGGAGKKLWKYGKKAVKASGKAGRNLANIHAQQARQAKFARELREQERLQRMMEAGWSRENALAVIRETADNHDRRGARRNREGGFWAEGGSILGGAEDVWKQGIDPAGVPPMMMGDVPLDPVSTSPHRFAEFDTLGDLLKEREGYSDSVYLDSLGKPTIGYGRLVEDAVWDKDDPRIGSKPYSAEQLEQFKKDDIKTAQAAAKKNIGAETWDKLTENQQWALTSQAFQLGGAGQAKFGKQLKAIQEGDYDEAARQAYDSQWYKQTPKRTHDLAYAFSPTVASQYKAEGGSANPLDTDRYANMTPEEIEREAWARRQDPESFFSGDNLGPVPGLMIPDVPRGDEGEPVYDPRIHGLPEEELPPVEEPEFEPDPFSTGPDVNPDPVEIVPERPGSALPNYPDFDPNDPSTFNPPVGLADSLKKFPKGEDPLLTTDSGLNERDQADKARIAESRRGQGYEAVSKVLSNPDSATEKDKQKTDKDLEKKGKEEAEAQPGFFEQVMDSFTKEFQNVVSPENIGQMALKYLGSRALGYDHDASLNWSARDQIRTHYTGEAEKKKMYQEAAKTGKYTAESLKAYKESGDPADLTARPVAPKRTKAEPSTYYDKKGNRINAYEYEDANGNKFLGATINGQVVDITQGDVIGRLGLHQDAYKVRGTKEWNARVNDYRRLSTDQLKSLRSQFGGVGQTKEGKTIYATDINPETQAGEIAQWAAKNGVNPEELAGLVSSAYQDALNSDRQDGKKVRDLVPYLNQLVIRKEVGNPDLFRTEGGKFVAADKLALVNQAIGVKLGTDGKDTRVKNVANAYYDDMAKQWSELSDEERKKYNSRANDNENGFYLFVAKDLGLDTRVK